MPPQDDRLIRLLFTEWLPPPRNLQQVEVPIVADEVCRQQYHTVGVVIKDDMLCAGSQGRASCKVRP